MKNLVFKSKLLVLFVSSCIIYTGCQKEDNNKNQGQETVPNIVNTRKSCEEVKINRLLLNNNLTAEVEHCYLDNILINYTYKIVPKAKNDKFGILNLSNDTLGSSCELRIDVFNKNLTSIYDEEDILVSYRSVNGTDVEFACECNQIGALAYDCVKRTYAGKLHYCDGNLCTGCSLIVYFRVAQDVQAISKVSAIILPNNF